MDVLRTLFSLLTRRERRNLSILFVAVLAMVSLQVASVASIMPFLSVASDPSIIQENGSGSTSSESFCVNCVASGSPA